MKNRETRMTSRFLALAPMEMRNMMGAELGKDEEAQFLIESEVSVGHVERDRQEPGLELKRGLSCQYVGITRVKEASGSAQRQAVEPEHAGKETAFPLCAGLEAKAPRKTAVFRPAHRRNLTHSLCLANWSFPPRLEAFWERKPA